MRVEQQHWSSKGSWEGSVEKRCRDAQLVMVFGATSRIRDAALWSELRAKWPSARIVACSTAGEIAETSVRDDSVVATAIQFERSRAMVASVKLDEVQGSFDAGRALAEQLDPRGLRHVFVLSDGLAVNGSDLVLGLCMGLPGDVAVTGGLAGDGSRFEQTLVGLDELPNGARVVALGLYGKSLQVGFGSLGGWDPFGPERVVTRARGAVLYELAGSPLWSCTSATWATMPRSFLRAACCFP